VPQTCISVNTFRHRLFARAARPSGTSPCSSERQRRRGPLVVKLWRAELVNSSRVPTHSPIKQKIFGPDACSNQRLATPRSLPISGCPSRQDTLNRTGQCSRFRNSPRLCPGKTAGCQEVCKKRYFHVRPVESSLPRGRSKPKSPQATTVESAALHNELPEIRSQALYIYFRSL
jgi:hypothetical protein